MLKFYYHPSPNPAKVALFLEESGLPYEVVPVDTRKGEQFSSVFTAINPNNKTPAIEDAGVRVFDSTAILLYLAEKTGQFLPEKTPAARGALLSWMMFIATGIGPYSGQAVHFKHFAPKGLDYAVDRYLYEARRHYRILDTQLSKGAFVLGTHYTIADMSAWGRARALPFILGEDVWSAFPHIKAWFDRINERPAAERANAAEGPLRVQERDGRGSTPPHVQARIRPVRTRIAHDVSCCPRRLQCNLIPASSDYSLSMTAMSAHGEIPSDACPACTPCPWARGRRCLRELPRMAKYALSLPTGFQRPTIVIFYRGGWCPYCNMQLSDLRLVEPKLRAQGFEIVFLSTDRPRDPLFEPESRRIFITPCSPTVASRRRRHSTWHTTWTMRRSRSRNSTGSTSRPPRAPRSMSRRFGIHHRHHGYHTVRRLESRL